MGGNVGGSASPSSTTTGSASPSGVGGKGAAGMVQPYQGGQQAQQGGFGPFGLGGFGGNQPQTQQVAGSPVENMLQSANQGQPQFMQQQNLGNAGLAGYPTDQLNQLQGLMGQNNLQGEQAALSAQRTMTGFNGQLSSEQQRVQGGGYDPQGNPVDGLGNPIQRNQNQMGIQGLLNGYGKGGGGSMPNPYQPQVQRLIDAQFNPASDVGMVGPGYLPQTVAPMPTQLGMQMAAPTQAVAPPPAPVARTVNE